MDFRYDHPTHTQIVELYDQLQPGHYELVVDSRLVQDATRTAFFALPGQRHDGHQFVPELYVRGVRIFVVQSEKAIPPKATGGWVVCEDPLRLLQQLAAHHRRQFADLPLLAITGSNGKTIVKDWLAQVVRHDYRVCASPRSYNSQIGVPLSVWQLHREHTLGIFEVGISRPGEMAALWDILRPTYGLLTHLGNAHQQHFRDHQHLVQEKLILFNRCEHIILPEEERAAVTGVLPNDLLENCVWVDMDRPALLTEGGRSEPLSEPGVALTGVYRKNALLVAAAARLLTVPAPTVDRELQRLVPLANRLERREGRDGAVIINDSYSNDLSALAAALTFAEGQDPFGSLTLILGEVQPLPDLTARLTSLLRGRVHRLILVGQTPVIEEVPQTEHFSTPEELLAALPQRTFSQQTVLIKGSSVQQLDRVADALSRQLHRTVLQIDLTALRHNFLLYRSQLPRRDVRMIVMTKASAYGSGALPVARMLERSGADWLAVAYPEEGQQLREGGVGLPILVLNAEPYAFARYATHRLEAVVHTPEQLQRALVERLPVHLELDTGMARLGFSLTTFRQLLQDGLLNGADLRSIFTHLAASEAPDHDAFTQLQLERFDAAYAEYLSAGLPPVPRHALNTNGISRFAHRPYELVRLGIGLYGLGDATNEARLHFALTLTTTITALTERSAEETIGYGRRGRLTGTRTIAVLSIGYADGLPRLAGEGRFSVWIRGQLAPTVGSICMDMCMVDVTGVAGPQVGDSVVIFGPEHPVEVLAEACQTIPYEILTGVGERVHRVYVGE